MTEYAEYSHNSIQHCTVHRHNSIGYFTKISGDYLTSGGGGFPRIYTWIKHWIRFIAMEPSSEEEEQPTATDLELSETPTVEKRPSSLWATSVATLQSLSSPAPSRRRCHIRPTVATQSTLTGQTEASTDKNGHSKGLDPPQAEFFTSTVPACWNWN